MRHFIFSKSPAFTQGFFVLIGVFIFPACSDRLPPSSPPVQESSTHRESDPHYHGLKLEEARSRIQSHKLIPRVMIRDGNPLMITKDYRPHRVNLTIQEGIVIGTSRG